MHRLVRGTRNLREAVRTDANAEKGLRGSIA